MPRKLLLLDDHQLLLHGITAVLNEMEEVTVVATLTNGRELIEAVRRYQPDLVLLDLNMPGLNGLDCLRELRANFPLLKKLVLTNYSQPELVDEVRALDAQGFLVKNSSSLELKEAVAAVLSGKTCFPTRQRLEPAVEDGFFFDDFLKKYQLTRREVKIIRLICQGLSTREIAQELHLSEFTISTHRKNIAGKLKIGNVAGLINFARENGLA
ncbi:response regulator transcription factor [Paraflavisolibacter sp. H34]|uniref:response regulator transcription factor n=1 Tax=Huijunlia imazamoxiresistens TaxID=3127457 RepID=UPI00301939FC